MVGILVVGVRRVYDPSRHTHKEQQEGKTSPAPGINRRTIGLNVGISPLALGRERNAVLDAAAALEDVRVVGAGVPLAYDVGGAEPQLLGQGRGAGPLDVGVVVGRALVGAAHEVQVDEAAERRVRDALELGHGADATVAGHGAAAAEGEGLDVGEEDGIFGGFGFGVAGACHWV